MLSASVFTSLLFNALSFGWTKYAIVITCSSMLVYFALRWFHMNHVFVNRRILDGRVLLVISILAFIANADNFIILSKQGLFDIEPPYFRPGLVSDPVRNVIIVNALIRGDGSPFLPGSEFSYQLLWYQFAALFAAPFATAQNFRLVSGVTMMQGYLLFFYLFWAVSIMRPGLVLRYRSAVFAFVAVIIAAHADSYNYFIRGCIEADGSCGPTGYRYFVRNFSTELATLASPQHVFFLIPLVIFYATNRLLQDRHRTAPTHRITLFTAMFLSSPIMSAFFLPSYLTYHYVFLATKRRYSRLLPTIFEVIAILIVGVLLFWGTTRTSPLDLFTRPSSAGLVIFPFGMDFQDSIMHLFFSLVQIPRIVIWGFGVTGLVAVLLLLVQLYKCAKGNWISTETYHYTFMVLGTMYLFYFIVTHGEIRRHVVILLSPVIVLLILKLLPSWRKLHRSIMYLGIFWIVLILSVYLHGVYIYAYTMKPSVLTTEIDWNDYACMNKKIFRHHADKPTLAAAGGGLIFPPVMEVTSSFAKPEDAYAHSRMPAGGYLITLRQIEDGASPVESAYELGFKNIIWGPLEDAQWSREEKEAVIGDATALETCGKVSLYRITHPQK